MSSRTTRKRKRRPWLQLLGTLILLPLALGWLLYTFRSMDITCRRSTGDQIDCDEVEQMSGMSIWSAHVTDARLDRQSSDSEGNLGPLYLETGGGAQVQFTSTWPGSQADTLESQLHRFLTDSQTGPQLNLKLGPSLSWRDWLPPAVAMVVLFGALLVLLARVVTG